MRGLVQGVGFRPFVYSLASRLGLMGWVRNSTNGVEIEVEGPPEALEQFQRRLREEQPPLASVEAISWQQRPVAGESTFRIEPSHTEPEAGALVMPDVATCAACLRELFDPADRRYRYPFINCTDCGPRFTIVRGVPYDRPVTTMAGFTMCAECRREYDDPVNRRFHAQPNACPACGPRVRLISASGEELPGSAADPIHAAAGLLRQGAIVAVKGLGGYHLACDPFSAAAIDTLRRRKAREERPFALMVRNIEQARELCEVSPAEATLLEQPARPIVLLRWRAAGTGGREVAEAVAPRQVMLGVMLAYTPLHHLLLEACGIPLVMTSGNRSDEPIVYRDADALPQLGAIADAFLCHDRPIHIQCDDSVLVCRDDPASGEADPGGRRTSPGAAFIRRSRGYVPDPVRLRESLSRPLLACGGDLKAAFCLGGERHAFMSHHLGDLASVSAYRSYRVAVEHYQSLFNLRPEAIACDLHPGYLSTRYAQELAEVGIPLQAVQHHHAHVASCLADNYRPAHERVIGVSFDGSGLGTDGAIWGGEFFTGSVQQGFTRRAHLEYVALPGGEAAIRHPWRMAVAHLLNAYGEEEMGKLSLDMLVAPPGAREREVRLLARMRERGINSPPTSSAGRLFDAVAALLRLPGTERATYEGQAAVELELAAAGRAGEPVYPMALSPRRELLVLELRELVAGIVGDLHSGRDRAEIAARFHASLASATATCCARLREAEGLTAVALSGGVFQNRLLLRLTTGFLAAQGFTVYHQRRVPANDGGLALGQAVLADWILRRGETTREKMDEHVSGNTGADRGARGSGAATG